MNLYMIGKNIARLILVRRNAHGNAIIQNKCNTLLDILYNYKYEILAKNLEV